MGTVDLGDYSEINMFTSKIINCGITSTRTRSIKIKLFVMNNSMC
jgi:hypothetical protein